MKEFSCKHCGKIFSTNNGRNGHNPYCKLNPDKKTAWNKGLTKETSDLVLQYGISGSKTKKTVGYYDARKFWNKGLTKETSDIIRIATDKMKATKNDLSWAEKSSKRIREKYNGLHFTQTDEYKKYHKECVFEKYGVYSVLQVPEIYTRVMEGRYKLKEYALPSGRIVKLQGYEHIAINILINEGLSEDDLILEAINMPKLFYTDDETIRRYFPDIIIKSENKIIEVKSEYTILDNVYINLLKQQCAKNYGYKFEIWLLDTKNNKTIIPDLKEYLIERMSNEL